MLSTVAAFLLYAGTIVAVGGVAFSLLVTPRASLPSGARDSCKRRAAALVRVGAAAVLVGAGLDLAGQLAAFRDPFVPLRDDLALLVGGTTWGRAWSVRGLAALLLLLPLPAVATVPSGPSGAVSGRAWGRRPLRWTVAVLAAFVLAVAPAFSGHALGSPRLTELAVVVDAAHVLCASVWIGGIGCLLLTTGITESGAEGAPSRTGQRPPPVARLVDAFSPLALGCGVVVVQTGVFQSWLHVGGVQGLDSPYGRALLAKLVLVTGVLVAGAFNWRRVRPLLRAGDRDVFRRTGTAEFLFAQAVLLATAVLTNLSPPA